MNSKYKKWGGGGGGGGGGCFWVRFLESNLELLVVCK